MSRHDYCDDWDGDDPLSMYRYRGAVASAVRGRRGQAMLRRLRAALDAMPEKRLIAEDLIDDRGCCALGAVARMEGIDVSDLDPTNAPAVAARFDIAESLAREIVYVNDESRDGDWLIQVGSVWQHQDGRRATFLRGSPRPQALGMEGWCYMKVAYRPRTPEDDAADERHRWRVVSQWVDRLLAGGQP